MAKRIFILGKPGADTYLLEQNVHAALKRAGIARCTVRVFSDDDMMVKYGIGLPPALVIDETVRTIGRVPETGELLNILRMIGSYHPRTVAEAEGWFQPLDK